MLFCTPGIQREQQTNEYWMFIAAKDHQGHCADGPFQQNDTFMILKQIFSSHLTKRLLNLFPYEQSG